MATTRIKDISSTVTSLASDDYVAVDGATNGTRKMVRGSIYTDVASAFTGAPTTYDICPLNSGTGKIDATYLPTSGDTPKGEWNASTNSPALADGAGTAGDYYDVTTAGTQNLGSGNITFTVGDVVKYDGSTWYKIDSVANFLDGYSTAATSRAALEVNSVDEDAEGIGTKLLGPSVYFDGVNDVVTVADDSRFTFSDGTDDLPFSISFWLNMDSYSQNGGIVSKYSSAGEWLIWNTAGTLRLNLRDGSVEPYLPTTDLSGYLGKWTHFCITFAGAGPNSASNFGSAMDAAAWYVNGQAASGTGVNNGAYAGMPDTSNAVSLMSYAGGNYSKGHIRNVQIYNRELTAAEVAELAKGNELGFADQWGGATATSGTLTVGKRYRLRDWITGDDFTNVGAASNADGVEFVATGTTPTTWSNSSVVEDIGTLADFRPERFDSSVGKWYDLSDNAFVGTNSGATLVGREVPVYESAGTWTPGLEFATGSTGITYGANTFGHYTRIGDVVHYSGYLTLTAKGSDTGLVYVNGLPFTVATSTNNHQSGITVGIASNMAGLTGPVSGLHLDGDTRVLLYDWTATGTASLDDTNITNTTEIRFSGTYKIA